VTLGANPNYSVVSTNGILSVTQKYCCNSNSRWQIKSIRMKILLCWVTGAMAAIPSTIPCNYCHHSLMLDYPIAVTLGANPNYSVVSTNGI
jgi:hypothetical protein